ncbi:hypothetical protein GN956_G17992 [Arapaima gigas]
MLHKKTAPEPLLPLFCSVYLGRAIAFLSGGAGEADRRRQEDTALAGLRPRSTLYGPVMPLGQQRNNC